MMQLLSFPKLICAAINGPAVGIGVTLLLHCDICHCTPNATFWTPFTRIALVPEFCSSETMVETMGLSAANEMLILGKKVGSTRAVEVGLCSEVVVEDGGVGGDPFLEGSIGGKMCREVEERLLSLPHGDATAKIFVSMIRARRRKRYEKLCKEEIQKMDERLNSGDVIEAAMAMSLRKRSKL